MASLPTPRRLACGGLRCGVARGCTQHDGARGIAVALRHRGLRRPAAVPWGSTGGHPEATLMRHAPLKLRCGTSCGAKCTTLSHAHRRSCAIWHRHLHQAGSCAIWQLETTRCLKYHYMKADMRPAKLPELTGGLACRKTNGGGGQGNDGAASRGHFETWARGNSVS